LATKPLVLGVGKAWISLDSLVRIEPFQWVALDFRDKEFLAPFAAAPAPWGMAAHVPGAREGTDLPWGNTSSISAFLQQIADTNCFSPLHPEAIRSQLDGP
jgi:hypothetical protein